MSFIYRWSWLFLLFISSFTAFYASGIDSGSSHDRLKYLSIAWSMYQEGHYVIPFVNGVPYTDKPPLLFWIITGLWHLFGVNMFGPQLLIFTMYICWGLLARAIYIAIFPDDALGRDFIPYVLIGSCIIWQGTWFLRVDMVLLTGILLCNLGIIRLLTCSSHVLECSKARVSLLFIILGTCIGLFGKGPVVYIFTFLPFLVSAVFTKTYRKYLLKISGAISLGTLLAIIIWAVPAALLMGHDFAQQIFYQQIAHRAVHTAKSRYVERSFFIYCYQYLPILFLPWIINIVFFKKMKDVLSQPVPCRSFIIAIFAVSLLILSCFGQKTSWYIMPVLPFGLIFFTRFFIMYKDQYRVIWLNRVIFGFIFMLFFILFASVALSPNIQQHVFKNFGGQFSLSSRVMLCLSVVSFLMTNYLFFSKRYFFELIAIASMMLFSIYTAMNVYFSSFERKFTQIDKVGAILHQQELSNRGLVIYISDVRNYKAEYIGQFNYVARLTANIPTITSTMDLAAWLKNNPNGVVLYYGEFCPVGLNEIASYHEQDKIVPYLLCKK